MPSRLRRALVVAMAVVMVSAAAVSCGDDDEEDVTVDVTGVQFLSADVDRAAVDDVAAAGASTAIAGLGADLYGQVRDRDGNLVVSPYSIAVALGMARAGAVGSTGTEMDDVLHAAETTDIHAGFGSLDVELARRPGTFPVPEGDPLELELSFANAVWPQQGFPMEASYLELLARHYGAGVNAVDYVGDAEGARQAINGWVADQTRDRIDDLIPAGVLSSLTRLVLTNALYLKAPWLYPFAAESTTDQAFTLLDGSSVQTPMMRVSEQLGYAAGSGWQAVSLPYVDGQLAMVVAVPDAGAFEAFEDELTAELIATIGDALGPRQVDLGLPSWEFRTQLGLNEPLQQLGMVTAFSDQADFSGMSPSPDRLAITDVIHEAFIAVDEEGTEAAAATAIVVGVTSAPVDPVALDVDRPFVFWIVDQPTGAILFLGRVVDPTA